MVRIAIAVAGLMLLCSSAYADWVIYCPSTLDPVYTYSGSFEKGKQFDVNDFEPKPVAGERALCPGTQVPLNGFEYFFWVKGYQLPRMAYNVETLLTFENGKFVWKPYSEEELNLIIGN